MIGSLGFASRLVQNALDVQARHALVQTQIATGRKAEQYGGYAPQAQAVIDTRAEIARREAYVAAIDTATPRLETMQTALERIDAIAGDLRKRALQATGTGPRDLALIRTEAQAALAEIAGLLNADSAGRHVFAGTDSANPPIPAGQGIAGSPGGPTLFADIAARVALLDGTAGNTLDDVWADVTAFALDDATPGRGVFSAALSATLPAGIQDEAPIAFAADDDLRVSVGVRTPAYIDPAVVAADPLSTGGWARDLMRDVMLLATVPDTVLDAGELPGLMARITGSLDRGMERLNRDVAQIGHAQKTMEALRERHADIGVALKTQASRLEDVDLTEASARLSLLRTQLETSWTLLGRLEELALARFI